MSACCQYIDTIIEHIENNYLDPTVLQPATSRHYPFSHLDWDQVTAPHNSLCACCFLRLYSRTYAHVRNLCKIYLHSYKLVKCYHKKYIRIKINLTRMQLISTLKYSKGMEYTDICLPKTTIYCYLMVKWLIVY